MSEDRYDMELKRLKREFVEVVNRLNTICEEVKGKMKVLEVEYEDLWDKLIKCSRKVKKLFSQGVEVPDELIDEVKLLFTELEEIKIRKLMTKYHRYVDLRRKMEKIATRMLVVMLKKAVLELTTGDSVNNIPEAFPLVIERVKRIMERYGLANLYYFDPIEGRMRKVDPLKWFHSILGRKD